jgi:tetratricopeptide (TPR) repeat protein
MAGKPSVFISYSHDSDEHKNWVKTFVRRLNQDGIQVIFDEKDMEFGDDVSQFMEQVMKSDFALIVCTPQYKNKADERLGGVGCETKFMAAEFRTSQNGRKFIPIIREGDELRSVPYWLSGGKYIRLSGYPYAEEEYRKLLNALRRKEEKTPASSNPPVSGSVIPRTAECADPSGFSMGEADPRKSPEILGYKQNRFAFFCTPDSAPAKFHDFEELCPLNLSNVPYRDFHKHIKSAVEGKWIFILFYVSAHVFVAKSNEIYIKTCNFDETGPETSSYKVTDLLSDMLFKTGSASCYFICNFIFESDDLRYKSLKALRNWLEGAARKFRPLHSGIIHTECALERFFDKKSLEIFKRNDLRQSTFEDFISQVGSPEIIEAGIRNGWRMPIDGMSITPCHDKAISETSDETDLYAQMDERLVSSLRRIRLATERIHRRVLDPAWPEYGMHHSTRVISSIKTIMDKLPFDSDSKLGEKDLFILMGASYLHCVAKQLPRYSLMECRENYFPIAHRELKALQRREHSPELNELVSIQWHELCSSIADVILMQSHEGIKNYSTGNLDARNRLKLLASIFKLADALDFTYIRAVGREEELNEPNNYGPILDSCICNCTQSLGIDFTRQQILVEYVVPSEEIRSVITFLVNERMQAKLSDLVELDPIHVFRNVELVESTSSPLDEEREIPKYLEDTLKTRIVDILRSSWYEQAKLINLSEKYFDYTSRSDTQSAINYETQIQINSLLRQVEPLRNVLRTSDAMIIHTLGLFESDYLMLATFYRLSGDEDKAIETYEFLIKEADADSKSDIIAKAHFGLHHLLLSRAYKSDSTDSAILRESLEHYNLAIKLDRSLAILPRVKYSYENILGRGGVGIVYEVRDVTDGSRWALKVLNLASMGNPSAVKQMRRESSALRKLSHRNIVEYRECKTIGSKFPYVLMQYLDGKNLQSILDSRSENGNGLTIKKALAILAGMCNGIAFAHENDTVHRDIKPSNVMIGDDFVKIIDFGLAKDVGGDDQVKSSTVASKMGTVQYMAPELLTGKNSPWHMDLDVFRTAVQKLRLKVDVGNAIKQIDRNFDVCQKVAKGPLPPSLRMATGSFSIEAIMAKSGIDYKRCAEILESPEVATYLKECDWSLKQRSDVYSLSLVAEQLLGDIVVEFSDGGKDKFLASAIADSWLKPGKALLPDQRTIDIPTFVDGMLKAIEEHATILEKGAKFEDADVYRSLIEGFLSHLDNIGRAPADYMSQIQEKRERARRSKAELDEHMIAFERCMGDFSRNEWKLGSKFTDIERRIRELVPYATPVHDKISKLMGSARIEDHIAYLQQELVLANKKLDGINSMPKDEQLRLERESEYMRGRVDFLDSQLNAIVRRKENKKHQYYINIIIFCIIVLLCLVFAVIYFGQ